MRIRRPLPALVGVTTLALSLTACSAKDAGDSASGAGAIIVNATDTECQVSTDTAAAGQLEFTVTNKGTKVNEFYVYAEGDRIVGEVENVGPGLTRTFHVEVAEPGTYQTACKPGMVGNGIRNTFTVTGATKAPGSQDQQLAAAVTTYAGYVSTQSDALLTQTEAFVAAVKAKDVAKAKALYPVARTPWERIEPVAESFGDLDPKIDGRADVVADGMKWTGYHRLEKDLWVDGLKADSSAIADQLLVDVKDIVAKSKAVTLNPLQLANGSKALLDEMATGKITGEEEAYSHTDLYDYAANWEGSKAAIAAMRPFLKEKSPELLASYDTKAKAMDVIIASYIKGDGYALYTELTQDDIKSLSTALDAVSEDVAKFAGVVAQK